MALASNKVKLRKKNFPYEPQKSPKIFKNTTSYWSWTSLLSLCLDLLISWKWRQNAHQNNSSLWNEWNFSFSFSFCLSFLSFVVILIYCYSVVKSSSSCVHLQYIFLYMPHVAKYFYPLVDFPSFSSLHYVHLKLYNLWVRDGSPINIIFA